MPVSAREPTGTSDLIAGLLAERATSDDLVGWAVQALVDGVDLPAVTSLACAAPDSMRLEESEALFRSALDELGIKFPEREQGLRNHFASLLARIANGTITPQEGLGCIDREVNMPLHQPHDLQVWCYLVEDLYYSSFREINSADELDRIIVEEARKALDGRA
ncbi:MAG: hypothetical protein H6509_02175 [Bryobacterales bacterium]|nr:hypothetical protein [Bryobacterales bacterium]